MRTIDIETVLPAILESGRAAGKSTEALRFHPAGVEAGGLFDVPLPEPRLPSLGE